MKKAAQSYKSERGAEGVPRKHPHRKQFIDMARMEASFQGCHICRRVLNIVHVEWEELQTEDAKLKILRNSLAAKGLSIPQPLQMATA